MNSSFCCLFRQERLWSSCFFAFHFKLISLFFIRHDFLSADEMYKQLKLKQSNRLTRLYDTCVIFNYPNLSLINLSLELFETWGFYSIIAIIRLVKISEAFYISIFHPNISGHEQSSRLFNIWLRLATLSYLFIMF